MTKTETTRAALATRSTELLAEMLTEVCDPVTAEGRMVRAWIVEALCERYPAASQAVEDAYDRADRAMMNAPAGGDPANYAVDVVAAVLGAIPGLSR